jgi:LysM repeat protein
MKNGITDTHIAEAGESLHDIAQAEGVRLESLMEYNKLNKNIVLNAGDKVLLQTANDKNKKVTVTPK